MHVVRTVAALVGAAALSFVLQGNDTASGAAACTTTLTTGSGSWTVASNWSAGVPTATSYACIPVGSSVTLSTTVTVDGIRIDGTLTGSGTLRINDQGVASESEIDGELASGANLTVVKGSLLAQTATMSGSGTTTVGAAGSMRVTNPDYHGLVVYDTRKLVVDGGLVADHTPSGYSTVLLYNAGTKLTLNGTLSMSGGATLDGSGNLEVLQNGVVRTVTAGQTARLNVTTYVSGRLSALVGTLEVASVQPVAGTTTGVLATSGGTLLLEQVTVPAGARLSTEATPTLTGSVSGAGEFVVASGTLTADTATMDGSGTTTVASGATLRVTNQSYHGLVAYDTRKVVVNGELVAEHTPSGYSTVLLYNTGTEMIVNGTVSLVGAATVDGSGSLTIAPSGSLVKPDDGSESRVTVVVDNDGTVRASAGVLTLAGGTAPAAVSTGDFTSSATATLNVGGVTLGDGAELVGPVDPGSGSVRIGPGTVTIPTGATALATGRTGMDGEVAGPGTLKVASGEMTAVSAVMSGDGTTTVASGATLRVRNPDYHGLLLYDTRKLVVDGELVADHTPSGYSTVLLYNAGTKLTLNGTLSMAGGATVDGSGNLEVLQNGVVRTVTAGQTARLNVTTYVSGRLSASAGTLEVATVQPVAGTTTGVLATSGGTLLLEQVTVPAGARLSTEATPTLVGGVSGPGEFVVASGTLTADTATMDGSGTTTVASGATLRVTNQSYHGLVAYDTRKVVVNGELVAEHTPSGYSTVLLYNTGTKMIVNGTVSLVNGATVDGSGEFEVPLGGLVRAVTPGKTASLGVTTELAGRVAPTGGTLTVANVRPLDGSTTGVLTTDGGALVLTTVVVPSGGRLTTEGTPLLDDTVSGTGELLVGSGTLSVRTAQMTGAGTTRVAAGATMRVLNDSYHGLITDSGRVLLNNGTVVLDSAASGYSSLWLNATNATLTNNGTLDLRNDAGITGTGTLTNPASGTITKTDNGAESNVAVRTDSSGLVSVSAGVVNFTGTLQSIVGDRLDKGTWQVSATGKVRFASDIRTNGTTIVIDGAGAMLQDGGSTTDALANLTSQTAAGSLTVKGGRVQPLGAVTQQGTVVVGPGAGSRINAASYTQTAGTTTVVSADATLKSTAVARINGGTLRGLGTVESPAVGGLTIDLGGRLEPGLDAPGTFGVTGNLVLAGGGKLVVDVDGTGAGQADRVNVSGAITAGGELVIDNGYTFALNDQVQILSSGGARTGKFASATGADLPGPISWGADYGTNGVTLVAARPGIRVSDVAVQEGNGATNLVFTVSLSRTILTTASVSAATTDGTALVAGPPIGGHDYDARSGTVTVGFDQTTATFTVPVVGDTVYEHDETLDVGISAANNGAISDATGTGTIKNDEAVPTLTVVPVAGEAVVEGDSGSQGGLLEARLSGVSSFTTGASWSTVDGTATAPDYTGGSGSLTFEPGDTTEPVAIAITGDTATEADEQFSVTFSGATPAGDVTLPAARTLTILDDDAQVSVDDATVDEPSSGSTQVPITFTLDHVNPRPVQFSVTTSDGSANAGSDYVAVNQTATIPAGSSAVTVPVTVNADAAAEPTEEFSVVASSLVGGQPGDTTGTVTIVSSSCTVVGTAGNDVFKASGSDPLAGTNGPDTFCGMGGNDVFFTGKGGDTFYGGAPGTGDSGNDTLSHSGKACPILVDLAHRDAQATCTGFLRDRLFGIENAVGGGGDDTLRGDAGANRLDGTNGNDLLLGDAGNDRLIGGGGLQDSVSYVRGTTKNSFTASGTNYVNHGVTVDLTAQPAAQNTRGAGTDTIETVEGVIGSIYNDWITGSGAANTLSGLEGNDTILGGAGIDKIFGLVGDDVVKGDAGADEVYGGEGDDTVNGGTDIDTWLTGGPGTDKVYGDGGVEEGDVIQGGDGPGDLCRQDGPTSAFFNGSGCEL